MAESENIQNNPLYVDLDGTLIKSDILTESFLLAVKKNPLIIFYSLFWLSQGRAFLKLKLLEQVQPDVSNLPYRDEVIEFIKKEKESGSRIILSTASHISLAEKISGYLGIFDEVIGSNNKINIKGKQKLKAIKENCNNKNFEYIGDSKADIPIWQEASKAHLAGSSKGLVKKLAPEKIGNIFSDNRNMFKQILREIRIYQWVKNILIFMPLILAHEFGNTAAINNLILAFISFGFIASGVYVSNDLFDIESDRIHPRKRNRPIASGNIKMPEAIILSIVLYLLGFTISMYFLSNEFTIILAVYFIITSAYSVFLKKIYIIDIIILAGLYSIRLIAGAIAADVQITPWLLEFSMFLFISLAVLKRYTELRMLTSQNKTNSSGRGYSINDINLLLSIGPASGYLSILVFGLYIHSGENLALYKTPQYLWVIVPFLLFWITRLWFMAHRDKMHDDPIVFAFKDPASYIIGLVVTLLFIGAAL